MKAAVLTRSGFLVREVKIPDIDEGELLIQIDACGVCSGDVFVYQNRHKLAETLPRLEHEASGVIVEMGTKVAGFEICDPVTTFAVPAYAEYLAATPETVVKIPAEIDPSHALGEPIACCVHAGTRFGTRSGDRVAMVGCGFMGLISQQLVRYQGAGFICAIDPIEHRLELAKRFGANATAHPIEVSAGQILNSHGPFDLVIEAAGNQSALDLCTPLVKEHGRIILVGYHQSNDGIRTVNMEQWNLKAIDVVNGHVRNESEKLEAMQVGMEFLRDASIVTDPLITTYRLETINSAFEDLIARKSGLVKAVLVMGS
jgi:threonine dehydrogenase-like Zn-dependent dehydrogenase